MWLRGSASIVAAAIGAAGVPSFAKAQNLNEFNHIVVIYQENHSFDNLYGQWGAIAGVATRGLTAADPTHTTQVRQNNVTAYQCLLQNDVNLTSPSPLATTCTDNTGTSFQSAFTNQPFAIEDFIASSDFTCPKPVGAFAANGFLKGTGFPGGCTKDIVHRYYNEQYQINRGRQNRYVTGSDASGLSMGFYKTQNLPIYAYLQSAGAPKYIITDSFYQGAFGGSFLNHQWLIAAASPVFAGALNDGSANDFHSVVDTNGMPTSTPLYTSPLGSQARDQMLSASCNPPAGRPPTPPGVTCGDFAVNTTQPFFQPFSPGTADVRRMPPLSNPTIGDRLSAKQVDWAWYSGGWSNANGDVGLAGWTNGTGSNNNCTDPNHNPASVYPLCPDINFQFHHQPFNYFANYAPGTAARTAHLRDEAEFIQAANNGSLKAVSFVKPVGEENEHPGYTNETQGSQHLVDLIKAVVEGPNGADTLIIVTYDEFGGQWDHFPPPPNNRKGRDRKAADIWGPGTRIPTLLISKRFQQSRVARADYDTTSILKLIETRFSLTPLVTRPVRDLSTAFTSNEGQLWATSTHDFNGEGVSDIPLQNTGGGIGMWLMNSNAAVSSSLGVGTLPAGWAIVGQRDLNGDGNTDILLRHTDGSIAEWLMNGATIMAANGLGNPTTNWNIVGTGDFNNDGIGDIVFRGGGTAVAIWYMNSSGGLASAVGVGSLPDQWTIAGTGDFDGDGIWDILWNHTSGAIAVWLMNSNGTIKSAVGLGSLPAPWSVAGTGDFNGDGISDILFVGGGTSVAIWFMNSNGAIGSAQGVGSMAPGWTVAETGDYNSDGRSDILWYNSASGMVAAWLMNGATVSGAVSIASLPLSWMILSANSD